ncbi:hypothetical protein SD81_021525 [Tolypothrix campylonemoides VB511288]|nr:hypothetical protein SD81_021525 [Tolypothrix campylonemoides VB511288]
MKNRRSCIHSKKKNNEPQMDTDGHRWNQRDAILSNENKSGSQMLILSSAIALWLPTAFGI